MWRKLGKILGIIVGWGAIVAYICYASHLAKLHRNEQQIKDIVIELSDSTATQQLSSSARMHQQLRRGKGALKGREIDSVDAVSIARLLERNGFIERAMVYTTYSGDLYINIAERKPQLRMLMNGYNSFATDDGYIFRTPQGSACYTAVATGSYRPPFSASFEGSITTLRTEQRKVAEERLDKIYAEYNNIKAKQRELHSERNALRKERKKKIFENEKNHTLRNQGIEAKLAQISKEQASIAKKVKSVEAQQRLVVKQQERLERRFDDFEKLLAFVEKVNREEFWSAEIVQMVVDTTSLGAISLRLIPRSGNFVVDFGTLDNASDKLDKLRTFYDNGLAHLGWERYKSIDVRYNKQVICRE